MSVSETQVFQSDNATPSVLEAWRELLRYRDLLVEWTMRAARMNVS